MATVWVWLRSAARAPEVAASLAAGSLCAGPSRIDAASARSGAAPPVAVVWSSGAAFLVAAAAWLAVVLKGVA